MPQRGMPNVRRRSATPDSGRPSRWAMTICPFRSQQSIFLRRPIPHFALRHRQTKLTAFDRHRINRMPVRFATSSSRSSPTSANCSALQNTYRDTTGTPAR